MTPSPFLLSTALAATVLVGVMATVTPAQAAQLRYDLKPGAVDAYDFVIRQDSKLRVSSADPTSVSVRLRGVVTITVARVLPDKTAVLNVVFDQFNAELRKEGEALKGNSFNWAIEFVRATWTVSPLGETLGYTNGSASKGEAGLANLLRDSVLRAFPVFVAGPVTAGQSWPSSSAEDRGYHATTRFVSVDASGHATLTTTSVLDPDGGSGERGQGSGRTEASVDLTAGALLTAKTEATTTTRAAGRVQNKKLTVTVTRRAAP